MLGLPLSTFLLVVGFPLFWILYTLAFLWLSRGWDQDGEES